MTTTNPKVQTETITAIDGGDEATVSFKEWLDWLNSWMCYGSDRKEMIAGPSAYDAISEIAKEGRSRHHLRPCMTERPFIVEGGITIVTPFGFVNVSKSEHLPIGHIVAVDQNAVGLAAFRSSAVATRVEKIVF